jgi:membrane fusion protein, multidrug efflux system
MFQWSGSAFHGCVMNVDADQKVENPVLRCVSTALAVGLIAACLGACNDSSATPVKHAVFVRTAIVQPDDRHASVTLTGEVQARFQADLAFRVSGRVIARLVDIGAHVHPGEVLARIDPAEQRADLDAATAAVTAAASQLRVAQATFERQKALISSGFTTRVAFDQAQQRLRTAEGDFQVANAQLGRAKDALSDTELHAGAAGVITAQRLEIGQVVQAAQPVFTLAQEGERDAVLDVPESIFFGNVDGGQIALTLVSDPNVTASGYVREVSPVISPKSSTVRVKVAIKNPPPAMTLGSAVAGTSKLKPAAQIMLPWSALTAEGSKPAVWIVDPSNKTASLRPVTIGAYEAAAVLIRGGLDPGERVVVEGGKLLSSGQRVTYAGDQP